MKKRWKSLLVAAAFVIGELAGFVAPMKAEAAVSTTYTLYRYKDLVDTETDTTTTKGSLGSDWIYVGEETETTYGPWSDWGSWTKTDLSKTDTRDKQSRYVKTYKTQYNYSKYSQYNSATAGGYSGPWEGYWSGIYCGYYIERGWSDSPLNLREDQGGGILLYGPSGDTWYNETTRSVESGGYWEYSYRTRTKTETTIYTYERKIWSDWSNWSTTKVTSSDTRVVETKEASGVLIDENNFPDEYFRDFVKQYDVNEDGYLSSTETEGVVKFEFAQKGISSLAGIECFQDLRYLYCGLNQISTLDVSQNTRLQELYCNGNGLSELDVSKNTNLDILNCSSNNLTRLDVSKNINLQGLYVNYNNLSELSVEKCTQLRVLHCTNNDLSSLDVTCNKKLTTLDCYTNQLYELKLGNNTSLETIACYSNQLSELDLRYCEGLVTLYCGSNPISELDVSNCPNLLNLHCDDCNLTELDIRYNSLLKSLRCDGNHIGVIDIRNNSLQSAGATDLQTDASSILIKSDSDVGWNNIGTDTVYVVDEGTVPKGSHLATGWTTIDGVDYFFSENGAQVPGAIRMKDVVVSPSTVSMTVWDTKKLTATPTPSSVTQDSLVWSTSNPNVVKVDDYGNLTAVGEGFAYVTVTSIYEGSASYTVPVTVRPIVSLGQDEFVMGENETEYAEFVINTSNYRSYQWESDDTSVVEVTQDGEITSVGLGEATVTLTVTSKDWRTFTVTISVTVLTETIDSNVKSVTLTYDGADAPQSLSIQTDTNTVSRINLGAYITRLDDVTEDYPTTGSVLTSDDGVVRLVWSSSDPTVASVNNRGQVTLVADGKATIKASVRGMTVSARIDIDIKKPPIPMTSVILDNLPAALAIGESAFLVFQCNPQNASDKELMWESDDPDIVSVNMSSGKVTGVSVGTTRVWAIQASTGDYMRSVWVSVRPNYVSDIYMGTGAVKNSGDGMVYENQSSLLDNGVIDLKHGTNHTLYVRSIVNSDAGNKKLLASVDSKSTGDAVVKDVTADFTGLEDTNQIFRIDAMAVGDTKIILTAEDDGQVSRSFTIRIARSDEWVTTSTGKMHYTGTTPDVGWTNISGGRYYFDTNGIMSTGWKDISGKKYYFGDDGQMRTGLKDIGGKKYYFGTDGVMRDGWQSIGKSTYFFRDGVMLIGWQKIGKQWCLFDKNGVMLTGWQKSGKKWYFLDKSGAMKTGWVKSGKKWYYMDKSGAMKTGWVKSGKKWYYMDKSGAMKTGWQKSGKKWYFFNKSGVMKTGWLKSGGKWYYFSKSGDMVTGSVMIGATAYRFDTSGAMIP